MYKIKQPLVSTLLALALLVIAPGVAAADSAEWGFCGSTSAKWSTATAGRSGTVTVTGECATSWADWRLDVYVNGEWWVYAQGRVKTGTHTLKVDARTMPKPNDKRGNYTWAKVSYTYGDWKNVYEEDLGYLPCTGCTS